MDNQFLTTYKETEAWLKSMEVENCTINEDLTVDVEGNVYISSMQLEYIPVKFGKVDGTFWCNENNLKTLKGCPDFVSGGFYCGNNNLISLKGCPKTIGKSFHCHDNPLTDFSYLEFEVRGNIIFTPIDHMDYLDHYKNSMGNVEINFNEFKKLQSLNKLNEKLNNDLPVNTNLTKKMKI